MYLLLPNDQRLYENAIVILGGSDVRYIVKMGWYENNENTTHGWYLESIVDESDIPITAELLSSISILSNGDFIQNIITADVPECKDTSVIAYYQANTKYLAGQIVYQEFGKLYQVCATYVSNTIESDVSNAYLTPVSFGADAPYTNPVSSNIKTVGDALDYIISQLNSIGGD